MLYYVCVSVARPDPDKAAHTGRHRPAKGWQQQDLRMNCCALYHSIKMDHYQGLSPRAGQGTGWGAGSSAMVGGGGDEEYVRKRGQAFELLPSASPQALLPAFKGKLKLILNS